MSISPLTIINLKAEKYAGFVILTASGCLIQQVLEVVPDVALVEFPVVFESLRLETKTLAYCTQSNDVSRASHEGATRVPATKQTEKGRSMRTKLVKYSSLKNKKKLEAYECTISLRIHDIS